MKQEANYIPEIFMYCDRWCERCPYTSQCMHFEMFKKGQITMDETGQSYDEFWKLIDQTAPSIIRAVYEIAEENQLNLKEELVDYVRSTLTALQNPGDEVSANPMIRMTETYSSQIEVWLRNNDEELSQLDSSPSSVSYSSQELPIPPKEYLAIIRNYQHQIYVKLLNAVEKLQRHTQLPENNRNKTVSLLESYGMAKVGLVLTDRSIAAWGLLSDFIPESNDSIFQHLILLEKIRTYILAVFPQVNDFVRPGFDQRTK